MTLDRIGFAGMTHLGLNTSVASAARGLTVVGFDRDPQLIQQLSQGIPHVVEPELEHLMVQYADSIQFSAELADLASCALVYIAPDVPTDDCGNSDLSGLRELFALVEAVLPIETVLVVLSQVPPGFCRQLQLKQGRRLYYQVETLIFGQAIQRALHPERFIIGCAQPDQPLPQVYQNYLAVFDCPLLPMRYESAELAKISINCCLVASIGVANTLAELCEHTGADWSEIVPALRKDKRIGPFAYLAPGLGIAGGNLERDLNTVIELAQRHQADAGIVKAWIENSHYRRDWVLRLLQKLITGPPAGPLIAVWGLAYKQDTHSTKNSPAVALLSQPTGYRYRVFDPVVRAKDLAELDLDEADSALSACDGADFLVIMTPWSAFAQVPLAELLLRLKGRVLIDPYRILAHTDPRSAGFTYYTLGSPMEHHQC